MCVLLQPYIRFVQRCQFVAYNLHCWIVKNVTRRLGNVFYQSVIGKRRVVLAEYTFGIHQSPPHPHILAKIT